MLIRSQPEMLERRRMPRGPLRVNWDNPLSRDLKYLTIASPTMFGLDLVGRSPALTLQGSAEMRGAIEGTGYHTAASSTSGMRLTFGTASPLTIGSESPGLTVASRFQFTENAPGTGGSIFGVTYQANASPFQCHHMTTIGGGTSLMFYFNSAASFVQFDSVTSVAALNQPVTCAAVRSFGNYNRILAGGTQKNNSTSNTSAPTYGGTSDVLSIGYNGINANDPRILSYWGAIWNRPLENDEAELLESNPYSLFKQARTMIFLSPSAAASVVGHPLRGGSSAANPMRGYL